MAFIILPLRVKRGIVFKQPSYDTEWKKGNVAFWYCVWHLRGI